MGLYCISVSFKGVDQSQVAARFAVVKPGEAALVSPRIDDYTTLFAECLDSFEQDDLAAVASPICADLSCTSIALSVVDSDHLYAWGFGRDGRMLARVWTERGGPNIPDLDRRQGFAVIADLAGRPGSADLLQNAFDAHETYADFKLRKVATILGIPHYGFSHATLLEDLDELDDSVCPGLSGILRLP